MILTLRLLHGLADQVDVRSARGRASMSEVRVTVAARSKTGRGRASDEDAFMVANLATGALIDAVSSEAAFPLPGGGLLLAVADSLGGERGAELATSPVLESLRQQLMTEHSAPFERRLEVAVREASLAVMRASPSGDKHGTGAPLTAIVVSGEQAYLALVGDSRAYLCRNGRVQQLTLDQGSIAQAMGLGLGDGLRVGIGRRGLRRLDTILVCCGGISSAISENELLRVLSWHGPRRATDRLTDLASQRCGEGNLTAVVAQFDGFGLEPASPSESSTQTFEVHHSSTKG